MLVLHPLSVILASHPSPPPENRGRAGGRTPEKAIRELSQRLGAPIKTASLCTPVKRPTVAGYIESELIQRSDIFFFFFCCPQPGAALGSVIFPKCSHAPILSLIHYDLTAQVMPHGGAIPETGLMVLSLRLVFGQCVCRPVSFHQ